MTFARPDFLIGIPIGVLLFTLVVIIQWRRGRRLVEAYGGRESARRLLGRDLTPFPIARLLVATIAAGTLVLAAAEPEPVDAPPPPPPTPIDLMVAVDVSHSMSADDTDGTRIERARDLVEGIVAEGVADRVSLSIFADWPFGLVPLTDDADLITFFAPWVTPELVGTRDQGTSLPIALGHARAAWERRSRDDARRIVLIVSDGELHEGRAEVMDSVSAVGDDGFEIWTAGIGTPEGAALFLAGSRGAPLLYDGTPVTAGYDEELLREISTRGRGSFHDVSSESGMRALIDELSLDRPAVDSTEDQERSLIFWLLAAALVFVALESLLDSGALRRRAT
jgi:Ca-activated chloride channel family protein